MKHTLLAMALVVAMVGCTEQTGAPISGTPAVTTTPSEAAKPMTFQTTPLIVEADSVTAQDPALLAAAAWTQKQCVLTLPGDPAEFKASPTGPTRLTGFMIAPDDTSAGAFEIVLKGETSNYSIPAKTGWDRTDVADFFKMPQLADSGFDANVDLAKVAPGKYKVDYVVERGGSRHFCESGKTLIVESGGAGATPAQDAPAADAKDAAASKAG